MNLKKKLNKFKVKFAKKDLNFFNLDKKNLKMPISVVRKSDGKAKAYPDLDENTRVHHLKGLLKAELTPRYEHGCRLIYKGKVMKSLHKLKHYGVKNGDSIEMEDSRNWSSSSSSSADEN